MPEPRLALGAVRPHPAVPVEAPPAEAAASLVAFSTRLPADLAHRLRVAAPQLDLRQAEIAALALDDWLTRHGH